MKNNLIISMVFISIMTLSYLLSFVSVPNSLSVFSFAAAIATLSTSLLLLKSGTTIRSKFWRGIKFSIGIVIIGILFKVLKLIGADILVVVGFVGVGIFYSIAFFRKPKRSTLDFMKISWLWTYLLTTGLILLNQIPSSFSQIPLLFLIVSVFLFNNYSKRNSEYERLYSTAKF